MNWLIGVLSLVAHASGGPNAHVSLPDLAGRPATASVRPPNAGKPHPVVAHLIADVDQAKAGEPFRLGVLLQQDPQWHTYWRSPGDVGQPTDIRWSLPDGTTSTPYVYPVPERFETQGIVSYGYDGHVLLFSEVTLPTGFSEGSADLKAKVNWLVCADNCIPGEAELQLLIPVGDAEKASPLQSLFDAYAALHPTPATRVDGLAPEISADASALQPEKAFRIAVRIAPMAGHTLKAAGLPNAWPTFAPIVSPDVFLTETNVELQPDGSVIARLTGEALAVDPLPMKSTLGGLLQFELDGKPYATELTTDVPWAGADQAVIPSNSPLWQPSTNAVIPPTQGTSSGPPEQGLFRMGLFAFLGGLLLNVMPCVLPVLTLKLYGLLHQESADRSAHRTAGLAYTAGVLTSFLVLAGVVLGLRSAIGGVGWGFQFQYPPYVATLGAVVFAFALSMFGVFEIPAFGANRASGATDKEGWQGHFFGGVFATLLGTPCSAPFLGPAVGFAFAQSTPVVVAFFALIAMGLAAPFLLITWVPSLYRWLPKPGAWMETFKHVMGFSLIATAIWLTDVLVAQVGETVITGYLAFLASVAAGCWAFGHWGGVAASGGRQLAAAAVGAVVIGGGTQFLNLAPPAEAATAATAQVDGLSFEQKIPWQPFSEAAVGASRGKVVFIDFTAEWCLTCKVNESTVLETETVRNAMAEIGAVPLKADWTRRDPVISEWLERHGRAGVPFYLVLPSSADAAPIALPEVITPSTVVEALRRGSGR
jgi:thiol:disulfide interchange protein/DsbC/DsbD-like thiol-disulfide interchange protein